MATITAIESIGAGLAKVSQFVSSDYCEPKKWKVGILFDFFFSKISSRFLRCIEKDLLPRFTTFRGTFKLFIESTEKTQFLGSLCQKCIGSKENVFISKA